MTAPKKPKIFHIVHRDRLSSIIESDGLLCDAEVIRNNLPGSTIGMSDIKQRRLDKLTLNTYPDLHVGDCVPFYFCPRSVMLYLLWRGNHPALDYHGGQEPIIHLQADFFRSVEWASRNTQRWAFTTSNAGSNYFESFSDLSDLHEIRWSAVHSPDFRDRTIQEYKQAEFLMEHRFPWFLVERIGVCSRRVYQKVLNILPPDGHRPKVEVKPEWYY